jgi:hypothetical protein
MSGWSVDAVWDIECAHWDEFLIGALWTAADGMHTFRDPDELANAILALPAGAQTWAHAGGRYDVLWLLDRLAARGAVPDAQVYMSGDSATGVRFVGGPWLRDSNRLLPMTLSKAAGIAGRDKARVGLDCVCGRACGGYCSLRRDMPETDWAQVERYLVYDVEILRDTLLALQAYAMEHDIVLRGTIGGVAWATARAWCDLAPAQWPYYAYKAVTAGYYGGRAEVGMIAAPTIHRYDRHSAYPAAYLEPMPTGVWAMLDSRTAPMAWNRGKLGLYEATVTVPDCHAPPLPVRCRPAGRLAWPYGQIRGTWPDLELRAALDAGCRLDTLHGGIAWADTTTPLRYYGERLWHLRQAAQSNQPALAAWLKLLANALSGKLAQGPELRVVRLGDLADDPDWEPVGRSPWVWARDVWAIPDSAHLHWAATITARARVELAAQISHAGDAWAYSDTDSVFATRPLTRRVGPALGEWGDEGPGRGYRACAPKVYAYDRGVFHGVECHARGVPGDLTWQEWQRYAAGQTVRQRRGVAGLLTAVNQERLFQSRIVTRTRYVRDPWVGARLLPRRGLVTRAPCVTELSALQGET